MDVDAIQRMLQGLEQLQEAEEERLREELIRTRVELEVKLRLAAQQPKLYRMEMSAMAKSRFIRAHGKAESRIHRMKREFAVVRSRFRYNNQHVNLIRVGPSWRTRRVIRSMALSGSLSTAG
jgi:hypothetical protein